jgi:ribosomal protein S6--L-glutamate ligase
MRICFLLERGSPPRVNPIVAETMEILTGRGAKVWAKYAEEELIRLDSLSIEADLYLLKSNTELSLSLALALETLGARVVNSVDSCLLCKDKVLAAATLVQSGIRAPHSLVAASPSRLSGEISTGPLILKPYRGHYGLGISVVRDTSEIPPADSYPDLVFAQKYLEDSRRDLKICGIGQDIFGIRKSFSAGSFLKAGEPCNLPASLEGTARRCAEAFGLELFGLDIAECKDDFFVVDVNYFPGYRGVPDAARRLADHILSRADKG